MKQYLQHIVYGRIMTTKAKGSSFGIVGISPDLSEQASKEILDSTFPGQIGDLANFQPICGLTEVNAIGNRVFFSIVRSEIVDKQRGHFPIRHCLVIPNGIVSKLSLMNLYNQMATNTFNRPFVEKEIIQPFELSVEPSAEILPPFEAISEYTNSLLGILDALFQFDSVVVAIDNTDMHFRLSVIELLFALMPSSLQSKFSFHTNVFDPINQVRSRLKLIDSRPAETGSKSIRIHLKPNAESSPDIKTPYVTYISQLLFNNGFSIQQVSRYCQDIPFDASFTKKDGRILFDQLRNIAEPSIVLTHINARREIDVDGVIDLISRQRDALSQTDFETCWSYVIETGIKQEIYNFTATLSHSLPRLPVDFWNNQLAILVNSDDHSKVLKFFDTLGDLNAKIILSDNRTLLERWIRGYISIASIDELLQILSYATIVGSLSEEAIFAILESILASETFHPNQIVALLEYILKHSESSTWLKKLMPSGTPMGFKKISPTIGILFDSLIIHTQLLPFQVENWVADLKQEIGDHREVILFLGLLGLKTNQAFSLSPTYLEYVLTTAPFIERFHAELVKINLTSLLKDLSPSSLGAVAAFFLVNQFNISEDLFPKANFVGWSIREETNFAKGFSQIAQLAANPITIYFDLPKVLESNAKCHVLILISEMVLNMDVRSKLLREASHGFLSVTEGNSEIEFWGDRILKLSDQFDTNTRKNVFIAYLRPYINDAVREFRDGLKFLSEKQCKIHELTQILKDTIDKKDLSPSQIAELWRDLIFFVRDRNVYVSRLYFEELLKPQVLICVSDQDLDSLMSIKSDASDLLYMEQLRRTMREPPHLLIYQIRTELGKGRNIDSIAKMLSEIFKTLNRIVVRERLMLFERNGLETLAVKVAENLASSNDYEITIDLLGEEFNALEQRAKALWSIAHALTQTPIILEAPQQTKIEELVFKIGKLVDKNSVLNVVRRDLEKISKSKGKRGMFG